MRIQDYIDNQMDTVYIVDHLQSKSMTSDEIFYQNTGVRRNIEKIDDRFVCSICY